MSSLLVDSLMKHNVSAAVVDRDHYRIHGGMAVETDYIIQIEPVGEATKGEEVFEAYRISKTYSAFRTLSSQLRKIAKSVTSGKDTWSGLSPSARNIVKLSETVHHLVESQKTEYLGKVNFTHVKSMSKQRSQILNEILDVLVANYPAKIKGEDLNVASTASAIESFFLTDFSVEEDEEFSSSKKSMLKAVTPSKLKRNKSKEKPVKETPKHTKKNVRIEEPEKDKMASPVVPYTRKTRRSIAVRHEDAILLEKDGGEANLTLEDDRSPSALLPSYSKPVTVGKFGLSKIGDIVENNPWVFAAISGASIYALRLAGSTNVTVDTDIAMLVLWASFCLGLHMPRPQRGIDKPPPAKLKQPRVSFQEQQIQRTSMLLRKSFSRKSIMSPRSSIASSGGKGSLKDLIDDVSEEFEEELPELDADIISPLPVYPEGAPLGEHHNCYSIPANTNFKVRGPKYLSDKKKIPSGPYTFPSRGVDLFITDLCPENVGSNNGIMQGHLRDVPTFIVNFRITWGVLCFYAEIPERFIPFLRSRYEPDFDDSKVPSLDKMSPADRTVCRWLTGDDEYKNERLKIVPVVVKGPWMVKSVVGGKPALIGKKLPVSYVYQPAVGKKQLYLEADLDIVGSSAARGILSVCTGAVTELTIDLGFTIEAQHQDELPEQMLIASRLHGIEPMKAPAYPPTKDLFNFQTMSADEDED